MKKMLEVLVDVVFVLAALIVVIYFLNDVFGVLSLGRDVGMVVVRLFFVGAPLSFAISLAALIATRYARYKWYSWVSGFEVLVIFLLCWIIYGGQI